MTGAGNFTDIRRLVIIMEAGLIQMTNFSRTQGEVSSLTLMNFLNGIIHLTLLSFLEISWMCRLAWLYTGGKF